MATPIPSNAASFLAREIASSCGGSLHAADPELQVRGVVTDSRHVRPGELYVALRGEHHDGHAYLAAARAQGAAAALVSDLNQATADLPLIVVADTRRALGELARLHRQRWGGTLVAITGSAGKTTTKELTAAALAGVGRRVLATRGNLNNDVGLPMTLFELSPAHDVAVVEIGTSGPGEIAWLTHVCEPQLGVVTTVALAHTERLPSLAAVADEKCALLRALPPDGVAIYGVDAESLRARRATFGAGRVLGFGLDASADLRLMKRELAADLTTLCVVALAAQPGEPLAAAESFAFELALFGQGPAVDATAALAVILALHGAAALPLAAAAIAGLSPLAGRMRPYTGRGGSLIIDDSYNANPASMLTSIAALRELADLRQGRALAALGDMAELGDHAQVEHARIGRELVRVGLAEVYLAGPQMAHAAQAARDEVRRLGAKGPHVEHRDDPSAFVSELMRSLSPRDALLVKGSRSMAMERVVDALCPGRGDTA